MNTFGRILRLSSFGESHGPAIGGVLDGFPAGIPIDMERLHLSLQRRQPGQILTGSGRREPDQIEILSGLFEGQSTGMPIAFIIRNRQAQSQDYSHIEHLFRPSHADDTCQFKYGIRDYRGGGRASARETAVRVAGGAFAGMFLELEKIDIKAYTTRIGSIELPESASVDQAHIYDYPTRCPHRETDEAMQQLLKNLREKQDSTGGIIDCKVSGLPKGLGEPVYDKLPSRLASAMLGINACKGFEIGQGFEAAGMTGSQHNDRWMQDGSTEKNLCGGTRGGISTGEELYFRTAFKPIPSIGQTQNLLDREGKLHPVKIEGRHDVCCVPRAVPVVEAMTALVLADFILLARCNKR